SSFADPDSLMAAAKNAKPTMDRVMNLGKGVSKALKATVVDPANKEKFAAVLNVPGPIVLVAGVKNMTRSAEKVAADYGGDWSRLHDTIRATVAVDSTHDIPQAIEAIRKELELQ